MKIILACLGSAGDALPFARVGRALKRKGHEVIALGLSWSGFIFRNHGLEFSPLMDDRNLTDVIDRPVHMDPVEGFPLVANQVLIPAVLPVFRFIQSANVLGETLVIAQPRIFGARLAQEKLGVPLISVNLGPIYFKTCLGYDPDQTERILKPLLNRCREELGLAPLHGSVIHWKHSPLKTFALYPSWFTAWEEKPVLNTERLTFPLPADDTGESLPARIIEFLEKGDAPLVFTPGTFSRAVRAFFRESLEACRILGERAVFITNFPEQLPSPLPDWVLCCQYVSFHLLLKHAKALVHHGGIGTCAEAMRAGIPSLIAPVAFDQFDHRDHMEELEVGLGIAREIYRVETVAERLQIVLQAPRVKRGCAAVSKRLGSHGDHLDQIARAIENSMSHPKVVGL